MKLDLFKIGGYVDIGLFKTKGVIFDPKVTRSLVE